MIFTMYLASSGEACDRSSRVRAAFAAGPRAAAISRNLAATSGTLRTELPGFARPGRAGAPVPTWAVVDGCENGFRYRAKVPELAVGCGEFGFTFPGELSHDPPQHSAADLQRGFLPDGKWPSRKKYGGDGGFLRRDAPSGIRQRSRSSRVSWWCAAIRFAGFSQLDHELLDVGASAPLVRPWFVHSQFSCCPGASVFHCAGTSEDARAYISIPLTPVSLVT